MLRSYRIISQFSATTIFRVPASWNKKLWISRQCVTWYPHYYSINSLTRPLVLNSIPRRYAMEGETGTLRYQMGNWLACGTRSNVVCNSTEAISIISNDSAICANNSFDTHVPISHNSPHNYKRKLNYYQAHLSQMCYIRVSHSLL